MPSSVLVVLSMASVLERVPLHSLIFLPSFASRLECGVLRRGSSIQMSWLELAENILYRLPLAYAQCTTLTLISDLRQMATSPYFTAMRAELIENMRINSD